MKPLELNYHPPAALTRQLSALAGIGALTGVAGLVLAPERAWANLMLVSFSLVAMGLVGSLFVGLQYACGAGWAGSPSGGFRRP